jgi:hypothetical protein
MGRNIYQKAGNFNLARLVPTGAGDTLLPRAPLDIEPVVRTAGDTSMVQNVAKRLNPLKRCLPEPPALGAGKCNKARSGPPLPTKIRTFDTCLFLGCSQRKVRRRHSPSHSDGGCYRF